MDYLSEITKIINYGINNNQSKLVSQIKLLINNLRNDGDNYSAKSIEQSFQVTKKSYQAQSKKNTFERPIPVEKDSRFPLADKSFYEKDEIWIELPLGTQEMVSRFIRYYNNKEKLLSNNIPVNSSILLFGPPGTGKTKTATYIASMLQLPLITARTDALISSYLGSTSKNIRSLMDYAQETPCVLFLDEFDALAKIRDDSNEIGELKRVVVTLLQNIDSLKDVILIAATNHEQLLDKAVWRRFNYKIEISLPDEISRKNIVKHILREEIDKKVIDIFALLSEGMSCADIESICYEYLKEKTINDDIFISKLLQLLLYENSPSLNNIQLNKKEMILLIKSKYNLSYDKISVILDVSKAYVAKIVQGSRNEKK